MKSNIIGLVFLFIIVAGMVGGCAQKPVGGEEESMRSRPPVQQMSIAEQNEQAYDIFRQILYLSDSPERDKNLPEITSLYREIIEKYPDIGLAQESYLRLVILATEKGTKKGDQEAEKLAAEFYLKYPDSKLKKVIENEVARNRGDK